MDAGCDPLGSDLVPGDNTIGYRDFGIGSCSCDDVLTRHNRSPTNKRVWVHTILDDCMFCIVLVQCRHIASGLVVEVFVMTLQVLRCMAICDCGSCQSRRTGYRG